MMRIVRALPLVLVVALSAACGSGGGSPPESTKAAETIRGGKEAPSGRDLEVRTTMQLASAGQATSLLVAHGSVWVTAYEENGEKLFRIDPATTETVATIELEGVPTWEVGGDGMAAGVGALWVTGQAGEEAILQRVDPSTNKLVAAISLGRGSGADVAVDTTGAWVSVFGQDGRVRVVRVDSEANRVVATIPVAGDWIREVFALDGTVFVRGLEGADDGTLTTTVLTVIDPASNRIIATRRLDQPHGPLVAWDGAIWAGAGRKLLRLDPRTGELVGEPLYVEKTVSFTSLLAGEGGISFLGYDPGDASVPATLDRLDTGKREIDLSVDPPQAPVAMATGPGAIWLLNYDASLTRVEVR